MVLSIDVERERISLGVKQLEGDPFTNFIASHEKNSVVTGTVKSIDAKGAVIELDGDVEGYLRASEVSRDRVEDLRTHLKEGDTVQAMIINVDRKNRSINLSVKAKDLAEETEAMKKHSHRERGGERRHDQPGRAAQGQARQGQHPAAVGDTPGRCHGGGRVAMTKSELIARLAQRYPQLVAKDAEYAVKMILDAMTQALLAGNRIEIRGFGSFGLNYRPPRTGRNPKSGEKVQVPEKYVPHFKAGKELRERVDQATEEAAAAEPQRASQPVR